MCCQQDIAEELHEADPMRGLSESLKAFKEIQVICCPVVQVICFLNSCFVDVCGMNFSCIMYEPRGLVSTQGRTNSFGQKLHALSSKPEPCYCAGVAMMRGCSILSQNGCIVGRGIKKNK